MLGAMFLRQASFSESEDWLLMPVVATKSSKSCWALVASLGARDGADMMNARWQTGTFERKCARTDQAPADSPASVILLPSPPKWRMFFCTYIQSMTFYADTSWGDIADPLESETLV